ncbi:hypothetical protein L226DRAFT_612944 [Lentinus tigrinus ALCF2SS1-7]|uniref:SWIM-type domain-containing protein n=1 Tax=Lentinus tigrinus ALCF2SS1-6 TaxID=1328759 RepID=A0A5C2RVR9_9APHY|nr:hypothetical protein L227DRAFT_534178 [Lentinus tigrinus ALCF2SS1-6]RPD75332.1 hypothetical protein L226DRAFT_612944 [Lentinus tigrinus ALCF2SS1-7]
MPSPELMSILDQVLEGFTMDTIDDSIEKLRFFFPETLLLAALDLIDRDSVILYKSPWGRPQYEVLGSTATYAVFPGLPSPGGYKLAYCTCPAYAYSVLLSETQIMCKHVLATLLAQRLSRCIERPVTADELASILSRQCKV